MDYKIEILEELNLIKVTTKFDICGTQRQMKIEGVTNFNWVSRYKFTVEIGEMFTYNEVVKNIQKHLDARNDDNENWWTVFKNLWKGENGKKVGVRWPL
jgi:hypothetical protein